MRALTLVADRKLEVADLPSPAAPASGEVQIRIKAVALNQGALKAGWEYAEAHLTKQDPFFLETMN